MKKYRKKPVIIEAEKVETYIEKNFFDDTDVKFHLDNNGQLRKVRLSSDKKSVFIETLEGEMKASPGDYIIKGINGELYPCKPDIFEKTYEEVVDNND